MKIGNRVVACTALAAAVWLTGGSSFAQQITGAPGSPSATTTIQGDQIPPSVPDQRAAIRQMASETAVFSDVGMKVFYAGAAQSARIRHAESMIAAHGGDL